MSPAVQGSLETQQERMVFPLAALTVSAMATLTVISPTAVTPQLAFACSASTTRPVTCVRDVLLASMETLSLQRTVQVNPITCTPKPILTKQFSLQLVIVILLAQLTVAVTTRQEHAPVYQMSLDHVAKSALLITTDSTMEQDAHPVPATWRDRWMGCAILRLGSVAASLE